MLEKEYDEHFLLACVDGAIETVLTKFFFLEMCAKKL